MHRAKAACHTVCGINGPYRGLALQCWHDERYMGRARPPVPSHKPLRSRGILYEADCFIRRLLANLVSKLHTPVCIVPALTRLRQQYAANQPHSLYVLSLQDLCMGCHTVPALQRASRAAGLGDVTFQEQVFVPIVRGLLACWVAGRLGCLGGRDGAWASRVRECCGVLGEVPLHPLLAGMLGCTRQQVCSDRNADSGWQDPFDPMFLLQEPALMPQ